MSKAVKIISTVASVATAVIAAATGQYWLAIAAASAALTSSGLLNPKGQRRQAQETTLSLGEVPRQAVFGRAAVGGSLVDAFNYGGKYGTDWEVVVIALADHECEALEGFYVNDQYVAFAGDGAVAGFKNQLEVYWRSGTETQAVPGVLTSYGPGWASTDNGAGVAYVVVAYKADDPEAKKPVWPAGRPRFLWVLKGARCYDPRLDSTVPGGSGTQRRDQPGTWTWTENAIVCRYSWVRGVYACNRVTDPKSLLVGRGLTALEAPPENVFAPANLCDELVDGETRYRIGGTIGGDRPYVEVEQLFATACGGIILQPEGSVEIEPGQAKAPVVTITDDDLLVGSSVEYSDFLSEADGEWVNTVIPRYVEPAQKWAEHAAPIRRVDADLLEDGGPREETLTLPIVAFAKQAGRVAEIRRRLGRLQKRGAITLGPRFAELEEGDWITWSSARYLKGASVTFRIESYLLDEKWHNSLRLREISSTVFADGAALAGSAVANQPAAPPAIGAPGATAWALTAQQLSSGGSTLPALVIAGAVDDAHAQAVRFEYWKSDGSDPAAVTNWTSVGLFSIGTTRREIGSLAPGAVYYAAVTYFVDGEPGDRRILGPVTAGVVTGTPTPWPDIPAHPDKPANGATSDLNLDAAGVGMTVTGNSTLVPNEVTSNQAYARSRQSYVEGFTLEGSCRLANQDDILGVIPAGLPYSNANIKFGIAVINTLGGRLYLWKDGAGTDTGRATAAGDRFRVVGSGSKVQWYHNNELVDEDDRVDDGTSFQAITTGYREGAGYTDVIFTPSNRASWSSIGGPDKAADNATVGARRGENLYDANNQLYSAERIENASITANPDGTLVNTGTGTRKFANDLIIWNGRKLRDGAGVERFADNADLGLATGGQLTYLDAAGNPVNLGAVTIGGLGYAGDLDAQRNSRMNLVSDLSGTGGRARVRLRTDTSDLTALELPSKVQNIDQSLYEIADAPIAQIMNVSDAVALGFNPSFNDWPAGQTFPTGWSAFDANSGGFSRDTTRAQVGRYTIKADCPGTTDAYIHRDVGGLAPFPPGTFVSGTVELFVEGRATGNTGNPGFIVDLFDTTGASHRTIVNADGGQIGTRQRIAFTARVPADRRINRIRCFVIPTWSGLAGGRFQGVVYYDNIDFYFEDGTTDNKQQPWSDVQSKPVWSTDDRVPNGINAAGEVYNGVTDAAQFGVSGETVLKQRTRNSRLSASNGQAVNLIGTDGRTFSRIADVRSLRDGDVVSYPAAMPDVPKIVILTGGNGVPDLKNEHKVAENNTVSGFTFRAKYQTTSPGTTYTDGPSAAGGAGDPALVIDRSNGNVPYDNSFTFRLNVTVGELAPGEPGYVTVAYYLRKSGGWVEVGTDSFYASENSADRTFAGSCDFGTGAEFGVSIVTAEGQGTGIDFVHVRYTDGTTTDVSLTPSGASSITTLVMLQ